jgi:sugar O-acyltransferase (sialic acid O-acetyltransferase NeuD family)
VLGSISKALENQPSNAVIAIGSNQVRKKLAMQCQFAWPTIVHPFTWVAPTAKLGPGTVVLAGAVIQPDVQVGAHCIVNTSASVDHDCFVSDYIHLCPGVRLTGGVSVGEGVTIGSGAVVLPYKCLGAWSVVGAGSVVNRDFEANSTVVGVPARSLTLKSDQR